MEFTGERFVPSEKGNIFLEHYHRYFALNDIINGKKVLDIASGEGYGTHIISKMASEAVGVDIEAEAVRNAEMKYSNSNTRFIQGSADSIPIEDNFFDVVVSFETIEHHDMHHEMMQEIKRVLKPSGILIMSSPDKTNYNKTNITPNEFHVKELEFYEFKDLIGRYFKYKKFFFQKLVYGSLICEQKDNQFSYIIGEEESFYKKLIPTYNITIASDIEIVHSATSFFDGTYVYHNSINHLKGQIENIHKSPTWRLGRFILAPFSIFKRK